MDDYLRQNRELWDAWTDLHENSDEYDIGRFKAGECRLHSIELEELGDLSGKTLLHLQCHFGLDTLSWARRGAIVTGVDFSEHAIALAKRVSAETGLPGRFICSAIGDLTNHLDEKFDVVLTTYGVLPWLPDLKRWGEVVARFLKPGGTFFIAEFHPFAQVFDDTPGLEEPRVHYPYFAPREPIRFVGQGSYAAPDADYRSVSHEWFHPLSEIFTALLVAGLRIESFREYPYCASQMFPYQIQGEDRWWRMKVAAESIPLTFSIRATR